MGAFGDAYKEKRAERRQAATESPKGGLLSGASKYFTQPRVAMPTWEYAFIQHPKSLQTMEAIQRECDQMGAYGWEMCERRDSGTGIIRQDLYFTLVFKRRTS